MKVRIQTRQVADSLSISCVIPTQHAKPSKVDRMHRSRINGLLIDCKTDDIDDAAQFWADALGRPVDIKHPSLGHVREMRRLSVHRGDVRGDLA